MRSGSIVIVLAFAACGIAQESAGAAQREAMKKLSYLEGKWAGEATIQTSSGKSTKVKQTEDVQFKLGGVLLMIEGTGTGKLPDTEAEGVVFSALAMIHYDAVAKQFRMRAHRMEGVTVDPELTVTGSGFIWQFSPPKGKVLVRYTATIKDEKWTEVGEVSMDSGKAWTKFMEMELKRVKN